MSSRDDILFITSNKFGSLYYHNVYSFYDEPIIFTALNEFGQIYFCYSLGCDSSDDRWIIVPTSQDRVNKLEQKDVSILKMLKPTATSKVMLLRINLENYAIQEEFVLCKKLDYKMPASDIYIRENINYDGSRKHSHKIRIAKKSAKDILSETLNQASDVFGEFCRHFLKKHEISVAFYPQDAVVGSFVYRVKTISEDEKLFYEQGYELLSQLALENRFESIIDNKEIDLRILKKLFSLIGDHGLEIQLIDENSTKVILGLDSEYISKVLPIVDDRMGSYLDSTMVPQADNLDRIKSYLEIVENKKIVTAEELDVEPRQVGYYRDACRLLSLIHDYSTLTPLGYKIAQSEDEKEWIGIIKRQFEESDCGSYWMHTNAVDSILKIEENTAADFLIQNCNGLSETTSRRRAQTLRSWVRRFRSCS